MKYIKALSGAFIAMGVCTHSAMVLAADDKAKNDKMEKCYGISKKGMNDCGAYSHSCQGLSTKDGDPAEYVLVPKGTCNKIVNGSLEPGAPTVLPNTTGEAKLMDDYVDNKQG